MVKGAYPGDVLSAAVKTVELAPLQMGLIDEAGYVLPVATSLGRTQGNAY